MHLHCDRHWFWRSPLSSWTHCRTINSPMILCTEDLTIITFSLLCVKVKIPSPLRQKIFYVGIGTSLLWLTTYFLLWLGQSAFLASWYKNYVESLCRPPKMQSVPEAHSYQAQITGHKPRTHNQRVSFDIDVIYTRHTFLNNILLRPSLVKSP
jgi:hypothetical protein